MASEVQPQHGTHRLGILHGARYATLEDLELALEAALSVNQHLNQEIESVLQRLRQVEQERDAWQQRAGQLAKQLQSERVQRHTEGGGELQAHSLVQPITRRCPITTSTPPSQSECVL
jgi:acyl-coenzyme A thioesterase PaaI-like protein